MTLTSPPEPLLTPVLIVDDELGVRDLLCRWLAAGYDVGTAGNADEALTRVHGDPPAVAVCDIRMPGHDGLWLAQQIRDTSPETAVIMSTGVQDVASAMTSLQRGAIDYLTKPFGRERLRDSVLRGVEWHRSARESRRWRETLEAELNARRDRIVDAIASLSIDGDAALDHMLKTLTLGDPNAYAHAYRVAAIAVSIARTLGLPDTELPALEQAALLHDLGKLAIPDAVLRKPAPLTAEEQLLVRLHPAIGADLMTAIPYVANAVDIVRHAHERADGLGFPNGVRGGEIPLAARIISVADAYDTMTRPRVFRDAISTREACLEMSRHPVRFRDRGGVPAGDRGRGLPTADCRLPIHGLAIDDC
jgi:putative nucleotidyltransferase with HDIG domain